MGHKGHRGVSAADIAAARLLLQNMGIDPADLLPGLARQRPHG
jgi:hypothetical protein